MKWKSLSKTSGRKRLTKVEFPKCFDCFHTSVDSTDPDKSKSSVVLFESNGGIGCIFIYS